MVSLDVYGEYAKHHRQSMERTAQVSRDLKKINYQYRKTSQHPNPLFTWLRDNLFSDSRWGASQAGRELEEERSLTVG